MCAYTLGVSQKQALEVFCKKNFLEISQYSQHSQYSILKNICERLLMVSNASTLIIDTDNLNDNLFTFIISQHVSCLLRLFLLCN